MDRATAMLLHFDPQTRDLLIRLAALDAQLRGGRPNLSGTVRALVRREAAEKLPPAGQGGDAA